jgi:hypothetical protein
VANPKGRCGSNQYYDQEQQNAFHLYDFIPMPKFYSIPGRYQMPRAMTQLKKMSPRATPPVMSCVRELAATSLWRLRI